MISMNCRVCYSNKIDIILFPCNHLIMCKNCLDSLSDIETAELLCPFCQCLIEDFKVCYFPE